MEMLTKDNTAPVDGLPMEPQLPELSLKDFRNSNRMPSLLKEIHLPKQKKILETLKNFWQENNSHDFVVRIGEFDFPCQRLILMVYIDLVRQELDKTELRLPENLVRPEIFEPLYAWMSDKEPLVKRPGIVSLLLAADYLKVEELSCQIWHCLDHASGFGEHQAIQVALDALPFRDLYRLHHLMLQRIQYFFLVFVSSVEFLDLPIHSLCVLLSSNEIRINSEAEVFYAAIRWLNHEWPTRQVHAMEVMEKVRVCGMPLELLLTFESPVDDIRVDRIIQLPELRTFIEKGSFDQVAMQFDDGTRFYKQIYEIFDVTLAQPRSFICHYLSPYHKPEPNSPDQVFRYADFLGYLGVLQTLPLDALKLLEKPL
ncbi:kelch-like protein 6 [Drosophila biarmipes]|uniref:kelch-like protein 6 n=1 Tax=Drosophila biarmipes TaxID=125945 RepID=UPI0007E7C81D|nr:kelch-like protein 6 [Drosophila biarmipes]